MLWFIGRAEAPRFDRGPCFGGFPFLVLPACSLPTL
jgi:hypothetical protein